jgi:DNA polymerase III delta prime subunit
MMNSDESKLKQKTKEILARRLLRDTSQGGWCSLTVGPPGCGKTSHLLYEADLFMKEHPEEIVFFRDSVSSAVQFNRIGNNWKVFVEQGCNIRFRNLTDGGSLNIKYQMFNDFNQLINQDTGIGWAKPKYLNVIYFKDDSSWIDFMCHLRNTIGWQDVFIDEIEDIIPLNPSKREGENKNIRNEKNIKFANEAKQIRKGLVNLCCDTQAEDEIDWRFKRKLNFYVYLRGARVSPKSKVWQNWVNKLNLGECIIDCEYRMYGMSKFPGYPPKQPVFEVIID